MLHRIHVQNFKSIADLTMEPSRVNVLIGENGCGKSNFLEALTFAAAAGANKLDNEFLASRGIRVTAPEFMRSAFKDKADAAISFELVLNDEKRVNLSILSENEDHYPRWVLRPNESELKAVNELLDKVNALNAHDNSSIAERSNSTSHNEIQFILALSMIRDRAFQTFLLYSPENSSLRTFAQEGQVLPLGVKGEGLFKLLRFLSTDAERWEELKSNLKMIDWFRDLSIAPEQAPFEQTLQIHDRFLAKNLEHFDQRSANEGFLFLLFYISLVISPDTPSIFAIDNIDSSLNPKTATALTSRLAKLAKKYNKQIFLTTHSPAVLDGLDLTDPEHRLFVFQRNRKGETRCRRVEAPQPLVGETPVKLSEAFLRGLIGGLPQNF